MSEETPRAAGPGAPSRGRLSESPQAVARQGSVNREQRKLRLVMTAFNIAKVAAILALFLLIMGKI
jgi:hypothetical protein